MDDARVWLTQEAFDRLSEEYAYLVGEGRALIAQQIDECRREGDLSENGGYHAAREEQAKQEGRIAQLRGILDHAVVGVSPSGTQIQPGMVVTAVVGDREMRFLVGSRAIADGADLDVFSPNSPLGSALLGRHPGEETVYEAPNGREIPVKVVAAEPFAG